MSLLAELKISEISEHGIESTLLCSAHNNLVLLFQIDKTLVSDSEVVFVKINQNKTNTKAKMLSSFKH